MREILFALILAGAGLQTPVVADPQEKHSDVKYSGPVVYTNLPPPVLYFPNFPEKPKFSNRGSSGDTEDKRIEYVPFPYKDLPLLVYQSESQPPVHVVENSVNQNKENSDHESSNVNTGYQTGPTMYKVAENDQYENGNVDSKKQSQEQVMTNPNEKFINVGLTAQVPATDAQNQQYISIGVTSIQQHDGQNQANAMQSVSSQQANGMYNQMQYSTNQNTDSVDYQSQNDDSSGQGGSEFSYYPAQMPNQNIEAQAIVPVEALTQAIKNYLIQHNNVQQQIQSEMQQTPYSYPVKQNSYASSPQDTPAQHLGITIFRQPPMPEVPEQGGNEPQHSPPPPPIQMNNNQGYDDKQQYVSIGVFPVNTQENDYEHPQQYYNVPAPNSANQYQNMNEGYRQVNENQEKPPMTQNQNSQTAGYQIISIDLSALRNKNANQQGNAYSEYQQQAQRPPSIPTQQTYKPQNENGNSHNNKEKEVQQILIQIPHDIISKQKEQPPRERPYETQYTGTAQVGNVMVDSNKASTRPAGNIRPTHNRPAPQRTPSNIQYTERPRNANQQFGFAQNGILSNGINISIIKQTSSSNDPLAFKTPDKKPIPHQSHLESPNHPMISKIPPPPSFPHEPRKPLYKPSNRPVPSNNPRLNYIRETLPIGGHAYPLPATRYNSQNSRQYRKNPSVQNIEGTPGIYASSDLHYTTINPAHIRLSNYGNAFAISPPLSFSYPSATKNHAQFEPSSVTTSAHSNPTSSEAILQAFTNSISNGFGEHNFDEINAFLNPSYDLFGSLTNGPEKKKVEAQTKYLQKVTSDLFMPDFNAVSLTGAISPYYPKPPANIQNLPFPYKYWDQPPVNFGSPVVGQINHRNRFMNYYSHMQYPYPRRPFYPHGKGKERKRGFGNGYQGLRRKLAELRTSIGPKSKIAPRHEITESDGSISDQITNAKVYEKATPRSTVIKTDGPGLDGVTIPLNPNHMLSSRISNEEDENENDQLPPIIVYKGSKPPVEIYGSKSDIEANNDTQTKTDSKVPSKSSSTEQSEILRAEETVHPYSRRKDDGYVNFMYSLLPDFFTDSFTKGQEDTSSKWLPVASTEYVLAEDANKTNQTLPDKEISPTYFGIPQISSKNYESTIEENVEELFSLLGKVEKSDLVKK